MFVTCGDKDGNNLAICLNLKGEKQWEKRIGKEVAGKHKKATGSNPSAVTDGESVFVYFKSGDFAGLDFDGNLLWERNLRKDFGEDTLWWDMGTSPSLTNDFVLIACMQSGPSYLAAFNKQTGEVVWKQKRDMGAPVEAAHSYSSPVVVVGEDDVEKIVLLGADYVTAHKADTGARALAFRHTQPQRRKVLSIDRFASC